MTRSHHSRRGLIVESPEIYKSGFSKTGGEASVLNARCGFQMGDWFRQPRLVKASTRMYLFPVPKWRRVPGNFPYGGISSLQTFCLLLTTYGCTSILLNKIRKMYIPLKTNVYVMRKL